MMNTVSKIIIFSVIIVLVVIVFVWFVFFNQPPKDTKALDAFAKCLKSKGVAMYGAYWCPHCQKQKKEFGESFKYVTYVECTKDVDKCKKKKINSYPTWIFRDGKRNEGVMTFEELAKKTLCKTP
jgi:hypothetical protein